MTNNLLVAEAHKNHEMIVEIVNEVNQRWVFLGQLLYENWKRAYWQTLGYETFREYLAGFSYSQSALYRFSDLYETYCEKLGFAPKEIADVSYEKLLLIKHSVLDSAPEQRGEWLEKAKQLSKSDLEHEVAETKANDGFGIFKVMPKIYRHKECGLWKIEIDPMETCMCYLKEAGL